MMMGNNQNIGAVVEKPKVSSKSWDWSLVSEDYWNEVSDEFLPVALRWKEQDYKTVLDLGCGKGRHSLFLAELGFYVTAVDLSPEGIEQLQTTARQKNLDKYITTVVCDMVSLPFEKNVFDCVLGFHSLYHTDFAGLKTVVSKITNVLKKSGQLYITFNSKENPSMQDSSNIIVDEYTVIRNYLDWLLAMPWRKRTKDNLDLNVALKILDEDHYGLKKPKERILEHLAVMKLMKRVKGPILCLVGQVFSYQVYSLEISMDFN